MKTFVILKSKLFQLLFIFLSCLIYANDGAFFASGNQLIPINETDIKIKKEILTLKKVNNNYIEVTVYYEFFNPKNAKNITVGFEAMAPEGDVDGAPKNGKHPYMSDFTVNLNNHNLQYKVAYVADSLYVKNGKIKSLDLKTFSGNTSGNNIDFYYVYHFDANFKKGLNIIKHTYKFDVSGSVDYNYYFEYVLTAANRWGNKQIDDFTLIIENGEFETFSIDKSFFKNSKDWQIIGVGKTEDIKGNKNSVFQNDATKFHIQKGNIIFKKMNFRPGGELLLYAQNYIGIKDFFYIPFSYYQEENIPEPNNALQIKILKNLPFARRGYVFKDSEVQKFYKELDWYIPDPDYIPTISSLQKMEQQWIKKWK